MLVELGQTGRKGWLPTAVVLRARTGAGAAVGRARSDRTRRTRRGKVRKTKSNAAGSTPGLVGQVKASHKNSPAAAAAAAAAAEEDAGQNNKDHGTKSKACGSRIRNLQLIS